MLNSCTLICPFVKLVESDSKNPANTFELVAKLFFRFSDIETTDFAGPSYWRVVALNTRLVSTEYPFANCFPKVFPKEFAVLTRPLRPFSVLISMLAKSKATFVFPASSCKDLTIMSMLAFENPWLLNCIAIDLKISPTSLLEASLRTAISCLNCS